MFKQLIVVNSGLGMPPGKLAAQVAHASMGCLLQKCKRSKEQYLLTLDEALDGWLNGKFKKIVLEVKSEEKLLKVYQQALEAGFNACLIKDEGLTFFDKPTFTCVGIGPDFTEKLDPVFKRLQVLKN